VLGGDVSETRSGYICGWALFIVGCTALASLFWTSPDRGLELLSAWWCSLVTVAVGLAMIDECGEEIRERKKFEEALDDAAKATILRAAGLNGTFVLEPGDTDEDPPELPVRESSEPLVGWRSWTLHHFEDKAWLTSPAMDTAWHDPILRADAEPAPYNPHDWRWRDRDDHAHGIYAHSGKHGLGGVHPGAAAGEVEGFGTVVVHERGFRAEAVRIRKLVVSHEHRGTDVPELLAERYQCPVTFDDEVTHIGEE
jgi:hypothetical protein